MVETLIPIAVVAGFALLGWVLVWGLSKLNLPALAEKEVLAMTRRVLDKSKEMVSIATSPDSDGGVAITKSEASDIRDVIFRELRKEASGPVGKIILGYTENSLKGMISLALGKLGVKEADPEA